MRSRRSGAVFVLSIAVLAGLVAILAATAATFRLRARAETNRLQEQRAYLAALSGVQRAIAEFESQDLNVMTINDAWAVLGSGAADNFLIGDDSVRIQVIDASSLVNLNAAPEVELQKLPLTLDQVESLMDWREAGTTPRANGAKDEYYNTLQRPYNAKLAPLDSLSELMMIRDFTPDTLYRVPDDSVNTSAVTLVNQQENPLVLADLVTVYSRAANVTADGGTRINVNNASQAALQNLGLSPIVAAAIIQRRNQQGTFTTLGQVLTVPGVNQANAGPIIDNLTVNGATEIEGLVNINTAPQEVLLTLDGITTDIATGIVNRQDTGFTALSELLTIPGVTLQVLGQVVDRLTINSRSFIVRVVGRAGDSQVALEAVLSLTQAGPKIVSLQRAPFADMPVRWRWPDSTTSDVVLLESRQ